MRRHLLLRECVTLVAEQGNDNLSGATCRAVSVFVPCVTTNIRKSLPELTGRHLPDPEDQEASGALVPYLAARVVHTYSASTWMAVRIATLIVALHGPQVTTEASPTRITTTAA